jgi:hypothetical protein
VVILKLLCCLTGGLHPSPGARTLQDPGGPPLLGQDGQVTGAWSGTSLYSFAQIIYAKR